MKLFHLSDLHIGKQLKGYSLRTNQECVLHQIVEYAKKIHPDVILICGDIYDKSAPSAEAYTIVNQFLEELSNIYPVIPILLIAGNHDSPERLAYASSFLAKHHIYMSVLPPSKPSEHLKKITLFDEYGPVNFYLLPFLKPGYVRSLFEEEKSSYEDAVQAVLQREKIESTERNVLLSHQFYTSSAGSLTTCESEQAVILAGGLDQIDISVLKDFDYVALGHLHSAQKVGREEIRYCGTPYKYSVSEKHHKKAITVVELGKKGEQAKIEFLPLKGIQDIREEKGSLQEILLRVTQENRHDFISVVLTDEKESYQAREQLKELFDYLLEFKVENDRTRKKLIEQKEAIPVKNPLEVFRQFYETMRHEPLSQEEEKVILSIVKEIQEEERV